MDDQSFGPLERELGLLLRRANAASGRISRQVHPDLEAAAYELLALIGVADGVRASDLAAYIGVGRGTMSRQISRLDSLGLVAREPDPDDFRGQLLRLTDEGRRRLDAAQQARRVLLRAALASWSSEDIDGFTTRLAALNTALAAQRAQDAVLGVEVDPTA